ncbi:MAG: DUF1211 domain-containing protein [Propionibacteriaceae bacterium]|nr:DUF1211 domain-containing protein [Propionibacteriaceae bacterium]
MTESASPPGASVERLVFFSDAAVAIALTLLILPLMEGVGEAVHEGLDAFGYLGQNISAVVSFVLSFVIIARFWRSHRRLFDRLEFEAPGIFWLNMAWLLSIVFLPVATAITGAMPVDRPQLTVYIGTMLIASLSLTGMEMVAWRHPETWVEGAQVSREAIHVSWAMVILMVLALGVALAWPVVGYWALLLLLLARPVRLLLDRFDAR